MGKIVGNEKKKKVIAVASKDGQISWKEYIIRNNFSELWNRT